MQTNQTTVVHFIADGEVKEFPFNFRIFEAGDVDVYLDETLTDSGYNVTINENNGGKVVFSEPPLNGTRITIIRNLDIKRTSDFQEGGAFRAKVINYELDYQVATLEQLDERINRSITCPPYVQEGITMQLPMPSSGKALVWNQEATALTNSLVNLDGVYTDVVAAQRESKNSENNAKSSELNAKQSELIAVDSAKKLKNAVFGNIGDIKYTSRTDVPNGGAWCDGAEYTQAMFPDIYQMLVNGKISSTDYTTFDNSVSTNGSCGFFALDTATTSFKVPLLKDVYIKAEQAPLMFGAESLPNIIGDTGYNWGGSWNPSGAFGSAGGSDSRYGGTSGQSSRVNFDASRVSSTYQDGAKVNPDHVVYRAYVVLYSSAAEASVAQAQEFMTALGGKANVGLDNITAEAKDLVAGLCMPSDQYIDLDLQASGTEYIAPDNGYYFLYMSATSNGQYVGLFDIKNSGGGTADENINYGVLSSDFAGINPMVMLPVKKGDIVMVWYNAPTKKIFRFIYAEGSKE